MGAPPSFNDLNKRAKDLLSKKYDFRNELKNVRKSSNGITLEHGASTGKGLDTYIKGTHKTKTLSVEGEIHSDAGPSSTKAKVKLPGVVAGTDFSVTCTSVPDANFEVAYKRDRLNTLLNLKTSAKGSNLSVNASVGLADGINAGGSASVDLDAGALKDSSVAVEVTRGQLQAGVKSSKMFSVFDITAHYKVRSDLSVGGGCSINVNDGSPSFQAGLDHKFNSNCDVKARINGSGLIGAAVEHRLANPALKVGLSAEFDAGNNFASKKLGVGCTFGDY